MSTQEVTHSVEKKSKGTIEHFKKELAKIRTGRASAGMLDGIQVDYYGSSVPILQLGLINTPESRLITVQVYDTGAVEAVEKAIRQADLGFNPSRDGGLIRINVPVLTEERRKALVKALHKTGEETKVAVRGHRRDAIDELKRLEKNKEISTDDVRRAQDEVQKITDKFTSEIDVILSAKDKELMEV